MSVPFNKPYLTQQELSCIREAHERGHLSGDGYFTELCSSWLEEETGCAKALLTHSCTAALEMAAILLDISPGDELIMPSYTFVSTANAFVLRGGVPVFIDVRPDTLNIDETKIIEAITSRTKAIVVVHYAGVGCEMDRIMDIAATYGLFVVEDAAQGIAATYNGKPLGSIGHLGCFSFHATKNLISGEGGALLINDPRFAERAEVIREKGTNRSNFSRGLVDKYTWIDIGSSFLPGEGVAAFLWAQMKRMSDITAKRKELWDEYHARLFEVSKTFGLARPSIPSKCSHNAHMYYLILPEIIEREDFIKIMLDHGVETTSHYLPLHSSPQGSRCSKTHGELRNTVDLSHRLVRLPLWIGLDGYQDEVIANVETVVRELVIA